MRAVGYAQNGSASQLDCLIDIDLPRPHAGERELVVWVQAVSVNALDLRTRAMHNPKGEIKVLGYDASGTVTSVGKGVTEFHVGDDVLYAASGDRQGTNAEFHAIDERLVGHKPKSLTFAESAALPTAAIVAWEVLCDRLQLNTASHGLILVMGAGGGVGSMIVQLAKALTCLRVIGTASTPESRQWAGAFGAGEIVDHHGDLVAQVRALEPEGIPYVVALRPGQHLPALAQLTSPGGHIVALDQAVDLDLSVLRRKSIAWHWQNMYTRPLYRTRDMIEHHNLLERVGRLVDQGKITSTMRAKLGPIDAAQLRLAHEMAELGGVGKIVVSRN